MVTLAKTTERQVWGNWHNWSDMNLHENSRNNTQLTAYIHTPVHTPTHTLGTSSRHLGNMFTVFHGNSSMRMLAVIRFIYFMLCE